MRIFIRRNSLSRFVQRTLTFGIGAVFSVCIFSAVIPNAYAAEDGSQKGGFSSIVKEVLRQMDGVASYTAQAFRAVFEDRSEENNVEVTPQSTETLDRFPVATKNFAFSGSQSGTLIINAPLSIQNRLTVSGESRFASSSFSGVLRGVTSIFQSVEAQRADLGALTVSGRLEAGAISGTSLSVRDAAEIAALTVSRDVSVAGGASLGSLLVTGNTTLSKLVVSEETELVGLLSANAGITTSGADVDLGAGSVFASNIVYEIKAGDGVTITGSSSAPTISVESSGVTEFNGETGEIELRGGTDIEITDLRISNESTLSSVRNRGGCSGCLTDTDVSNTLTLTDGSIDGVIIGATETAAAYLSTLAVGTTTATTSVFRVYGSATSTFAGGIDLESGCFSINGVCVVGASTTSYTGLSGTPDALIAGAIQYVDAVGSSVTQSANFVFDGSSLGVGTSSPSANLSVVGTSLLTGAVTIGGDLGLQNASTLMFYDSDNTNHVGLVASSSLSGNTVWTLPTGDGNSDEVLVTDGSGQLRFADIATLSGGAIDTFLGLTDTPSNYATGSIPYMGTSSLLFSTDFVYDGSSLGVGTSSPSATLAVVGSANLTGALIVGGDISVRDRSVARFYNSANTYYAGFRASSSQASNVVWDLPAVDGGNDEVLVTDGNGHLRFAPVAQIGGGVDTYLELTDTPSSFIAGAIPYANAATTSLTQSANLRYTGSYFGIGPATPTAELTVDGSVDFIAHTGAVDFTYNDSSRKFGIGTETLVDKLTIKNGSLYQRGGASGELYSPSLVRIVSLGGTGFDIAIAGGYAYVTTNDSTDEFKVLDIGNSAQPVEVGSVDLPARGNAVAVAGKYAYAVSGYQGDDFHVIDISDPANPVEVDSLDLVASANDVVIVGHYAYVVTDDVSSNFVVIDISDPLNVAVVGTTSLVTNVRGVAVYGDYAFAVSETLGNDFHAIDISDPTNPTEVDSLDMPATANAVVVSPSGARAYVALDSTGDDIIAIDISDPTNLVEKDGVELSVSALDVYQVGEIVYMTSATAGQDLHVIDVSSPSTPVSIGGVDLGSGDANAVALVGRYAYVITTAGLVVVDISGAKLQSVLTTSLEASEIFVGGRSNFGDSLTAQGSVFTGADLSSVGQLYVNGDGSSFIAGGLSVGTTSTSTGLLVDGAVNFTNLTANTGAGSLCLSATGEVVYNSGSDNCLTSTRNTKHDIIDLSLATSSVDLINMLNPVSFVYNVDPTERTRYGFIADDVVLVDDHLGTYNYENILTGLDTNGFLALIIGAIQEIWASLQGTQTEVEALKEQVTELEGLQGRIEELEAQLNDTSDADDTNGGTNDAEDDSDPEEDIASVLEESASSTETEGQEEAASSTKNTTVAEEDLIDPVVDDTGSDDSLAEEEVAEEDEEVASQNDGAEASESETDTVVLEGKDGV